MVYSLKQRHSVLWIFHATHHVKETKNNDKCNISLNKCPHSNKHPLVKKKCPPLRLQSQTSIPQRRALPSSLYLENHFIYNSFKSFNYSKVSTGE